jgi:hypothetical protein
VEVKSCIIKGNNGTMQNTSRLDVKEETREKEGEEKPSRLE